MPIYQINDESIRQAAQAINEGKIVAFPTETVYGLGGNAFNAAAVAKIFEVKNRPQFDPLIVHISKYETLEKVADLSLLEKKALNNFNLLIHNFWPGPFTLILPKKAEIPGIVSSGLPTVAVRMSSNETTSRLIELSSGAIAAPSANPFGYLSPTRAEHVFEMLGNKIEIILDGGPSTIGLESTILDICHGQPRILRPGGITKETIEALIGNTLSGSASEKEVMAPGMLINHYAPRIQLKIFNLNSLCQISADEDCAFLFFDGTSRDVWLTSQRSENIPFVKVLSETGNMPEAAVNLFETLYNLDQLEIKNIYVQLAPEEGIGVAINDRLKKAAVK